MLTSFFNKSKPINFTIVFFITLLAFIIARKQLINDGLFFEFLFKQMSFLLICYISVLLLNFITSKNSLTHRNSFEILLFSLFLLLIPQTTSYGNVLISNFFVLLGLRRLISIRSQKDEKKKLFDAAFWIGIATLFYFWSILFFALIIISLILYGDSRIRNWIIPFIGILVVCIIGVAVSVIWHDDFTKIFNLSSEISYDFSNYNSLKYMVAITLLLSFGIWSSIFYLQNIKTKKKKFRAPFKIIISATFISFLLVIQVSEKNGSEFLFLFAPLSIIIANYIEIIQDKWFKEVFLSILILVPFILLVL
jgi:hypothetical protein